jgi:hypothetical protein
MIAAVRSVIWKLSGQPSLLKKKEGNLESFSRIALGNPAILSFSKVTGPHHETA